MKKTQLKEIGNTPHPKAPHVWRHWCPINKKRCDFPSGKCEQFQCIYCGLWQKDQHEYRCFRCSRYFIIENRILDTDKPTCDRCFKDLLNVKTPDEYYDFLSGVKL